MKEKFTMPKKLRGFEGIENKKRKKLGAAANRPQGNRNEDEKHRMCPHTSWLCIGIMKICFSGNVNKKVGRFTEK